MGACISTVGDSSWRSALAATALVAFQSRAGLQLPRIHPKLGGKRGQHFVHLYALLEK
jgi:hypothetical protein